MRSQGERAAVAVVACILAGVRVWADGFRTPPEGAGVLARGGTKLTTAEGGPPVIHNPANLLEEMRSVGMSLLVAYGEKDYRMAGGASESTRATWAAFPCAWATWQPPESCWALGIALHSPYGQVNEWPEHGLQTGRSQAYYTAVRTLNVSPGAAFRLWPSLWVGAGLDVLRAEAEFRNATTLPASDWWMRMTLEGDGFGWGWHAGMTWLLTPRQRLAVVYRTGVSVDCEGEYRVTPDFTVPPPLHSSGDFHTELRFPAVAGGGYAIQVRDDLHVEVNVEWVQHSRYRRAVIDLGPNNPLLHREMLSGLEPINPEPWVVPQEWDETWTFGVGADWQWAPGWTLRTGWSYVPSPVPRETLSASNAEGDQHVLALGVGFRRGTHAADVAVARPVASDRADAAGGEYEFDSLLMAAAYRWAF